VTAPGLSSEVSHSTFSRRRDPGGTSQPHLLRLNWMAKSDMTCSALFVRTRSMEMEPTCRLKVPEISSPLAFMAGSQTWVKETRNPRGFAQSEPFGALPPGRVAQGVGQPGALHGYRHAVGRGRAVGRVSCRVLQTSPCAPGSGAPHRSLRSPSLLQAPCHPRNTQTASAPRLGKDCWAG